MGSYLSKCNRDKETSTGQSDSGSYQYVHTSMQGWRVNMEDAYCCHPNFNLLANLGLYAVFDGHGGLEVAEYVSTILPEKIAEQLAKRPELEKLVEKYSTDLEAYSKKQDQQPDFPQPDSELLKEFASILYTVLLKIDCDIVQKDTHKKLKKIADRNDKGSTQNSSDSEDEQREREQDLIDLMNDDDNNLSVEELAKKYGQPMTSSPDKSASCSSSSKSSSKKETDGQIMKTLPLTTAFDIGNESDSSVSSSAKEEEGEASTNVEEVNTNNMEEDIENTDSESSRSVSSDHEDTEDKNEKDSESNDFIVDDKIPGNPFENGEVEKDLQQNGDKNKSESKKPKIDLGREIEFIGADGEPMELDDEDPRKAIFKKLLGGGELDDEDHVFGGDGWEDSTEDSVFGEQKCGIESGTTAVVGLLTESGLLVIANIGDSRAMVGRTTYKPEAIKNNNQPDQIPSNTYLAIDLSIDHKPEDQIELDRIHKAGGRITPDGRVDGGLNLSRCLGDHLYKQYFDLSLTEQKISCLPDIRFIQLTSSDRFIVLACDGIWNCMSSQKVAEFVGTRLDQNISTNKITEELLDTIVAPDTKGDGTGCDNMTVVIIKIDQEKHRFLKKLQNDEKIQEVNTEQHIVEENIEEDNKIGPSPYGPSGATPYSKDDPANVNMADGSAKILGKLIDHKIFRDHDFDFNLDENLWTTEKIIGQVSSTSPSKNSEKSDKENVEPTENLNGESNVEKIEGQPPAKRSRQSSKI